MESYLFRTEANVVIITGVPLVGIFIYFCIFYLCHYFQIQIPKRRFNNLYSFEIVVQIVAIGTPEELKNFMRHGERKLCL